MRAPSDYHNPMAVRSRLIGRGLSLSVSVEWKRRKVAETEGKEEDDLQLLNVRTVRGHGASLRSAELTSARAGELRPGRERWPVLTAQLLGSVWRWPSLHHVRSMSPPPNPLRRVWIISDWLAQFLRVDASRLPRGKAGKGGNRWSDWVTELSTLWLKASQRQQVLVFCGANPSIVEAVSNKLPFGITESQTENSTPYFQSPNFQICWTYYYNR